MIERRAHSRAEHTAACAVVEIEPDSGWYAVAAVVIDARGNPVDEPFWGVARPTTQEERRVRLEDIKTPERRIQRPYVSALRQRLKSWLYKRGAPRTVLEGSVPLEASFFRQLRSEGFLCFEFNVHMGRDDLVTADALGVYVHDMSAAPLERRKNVRDEAIRVAHLRALAILKRDCERRG